MESSDRKYLSEGKRIIKALGRFRYATSRLVKSIFYDCCNWYYAAIGNKVQGIKGLHFYVSSTQKN